MLKIAPVFFLFFLWQMNAQGVGINTTSPQATLHVAGDFKFNPKTTIDATKLVAVTSTGAVKEFPLGDNLDIVNGELVVVEEIDENIFLVGDVDQSPVAATTTDYNDYEIGLVGNNANNTIIRITGETAGYNVTGFASGYGGRIFYLYNAQNNNVTFYNLDSRSASENQIITGTGANVGISSEGVAEFIYDEDMEKWILINIRN